MTDETPNSQSDSDRQKPNPPTTPNHQRPNKLKIKACDLTVEAESRDMDVDEMMAELSPEMESLMRHHLAGEYEVIEEEDLFAQIFGSK